MKKWFLLLLFLTGCAHNVPITVKFPEPPNHSAMESCPNLQKLEDDAKLSDVSTVINNNYSEYYLCAVKNDAWIEWYRIQKTIYEELK